MTGGFYYLLFGGCYFFCFSLSFLFVWEDATLKKLIVTAYFKFGVTVFEKIEGFLGMQTPLFPFYYSRAPIYRLPIYRLPRIQRAFFLYPEYKLHVKINENSTPMYCSPLTVYSSFPPKLHGKWGYEGI